MKYIMFVMLLFVILVTLTGCVKGAEVCNYDSVCTADETDECADCKGVLGRDVDVSSNDAEVKGGP